MLRVILISPGFTADEHDRNCLPTLQLYVQELVRQQLDVHVVALDYPFSDQPYAWAGATIHPCNGGNQRWLKPRTFWRATRICRQLLQDGVPAILHSFWLGWPSAVGERAARLQKTRHITTLMGQDVLPQNRHWLRALTAARQSRLVVLSDFQNDALEKNAGFRAPQVIPWGVSSDEIPLLLPDSRPVDVLGAGSLIPLKNWPLWLETIALLSRKKPGLRAELIGAGPSLPPLIARAQALGIEQTVHFSGECTRPKVLERMQQAKLLLHTSNYESQGYVLSEAAMNGCRIVSTPVGIGPMMGACAETASELAALVQRALDTTPPIRSYTPFLMADTVAAYRALYG